MQSNSAANSKASASSSPERGSYDGTPELFQVGVRGARPLCCHVDQYLGMGCSGIGHELR